MRSSQSLRWLLNANLGLVKTLDDLDEVKSGSLNQSDESPVND